MSRALSLRNNAFVLLLAFALFHGALAKEAQAQAFHYNVALQAAGASEDTLPFWLTTNRYGTVDPSGPNVATRLGGKGGSLVAAVVRNNQNLNINSLGAG